MNQTVNFLKELVAIPSPTGYTKDVQDYLIDVLKDMGYEPNAYSKRTSGCNSTWSNG